MESWKLVELSDETSARTFFMIYRELSEWVSRAGYQGFFSIYDWVCLSVWLLWSLTRYGWTSEPAVLLYQYIRTCCSNCSISRFFEVVCVSTMHACTSARSVLYSLTLSMEKIPLGKFETDLSHSLCLPACLPACLELKGLFLYSSRLHFRWVFDDLEHRWLIKVSSECLFLFNHPARSI